MPALKNLNQKTQPQDSLMKLTQILLTTAVSCLLMPNVVSADIFNVPATANIYSAGLATPVAPGGGGAGILPVQITLTPGLGTFQFQVSGNVSPNMYDGPFNLTAEGTPNYATSLNAYGGISGLIADHAFSLVGVFLTAVTPQAPPPSTLDFSPGAIGRNFLSLSPQIGQVFFIGNGVTDGNQTQTFYAPVGATRLYLGFGDGYYFQGNIGEYQNNSGSLNASVTAVPEPASAALILAGVALMVAVRGRNKR
jgi:hypothetical protein